MRIAHRCSSESELTYEHDEFTPSPGSEENPDKFLCTMMKVNNFIFLPLFLFKEKKMIYISLWFIIIQKVLEWSSLFNLFLSSELNFH